MPSDDEKLPPPGAIALKNAFEFAEQVARECIAADTDRWLASGAHWEDEPRDPDTTHPIDLLEDQLRRGMVRWCGPR